MARIALAAGDNGIARQHRHGAAQRVAAAKAWRNALSVWRNNGIAAAWQS